MRVQQLEDFLLSSRALKDMQDENLIKWVEEVYPLRLEKTFVFESYMLDHCSLEMLKYVYEYQVSFTRLKKIRCLGTRWRVELS
jgi:hypothetical protein